MRITNDGFGPVRFSVNHLADSFLTGLSALSAGLSGGLGAICLGLGRSATGNSSWLRHRRDYSPAPEAEGKIRGVLLLSFAFMESLCIYGLVISLAILFANPFI